MCTHMTERANEETSSYYRVLAKFLSISYHQLQWAMIALLTLNQRGAGCTSVDIVKSTREFCITVQALTIAQVYELLLKHTYKQLHKGHVFQHINLVVVMVLFTTYMAFRRPWMVYSKQVDVGCVIRDCDTGHVVDRSL